MHNRAMEQSLYNKNLAFCGFGKLLLKNHYFCGKIQNLQFINLKLKMTRNIYIALILIVFTACNSRKNEEAAADIKLTAIKALIAQNKLNEAKSQIDSIHAIFPRLVKKRQEAVALNDTIILRESYRTLAYCSKTLPDLIKTVQSLEKEFVFTKNTNYEEFGKFTYENQAGNQKTARSQIFCEIDENNDLYVTSVYRGSKINQYAIKVHASAGLTASTDSTNKNVGVNHSFNIENTNVEQLTFKNESDGGIVKFIHENKQMDLKITLMGTKKFTYQLSPSNKEAISKSFALASARKLLKKTENDSRIAQQRIGKIKLLYNN